MVTAFMPGLTSAERVARSPGPVILSESTGSFGSIAVRTTRRPRHFLQHRLIEFGAEAQRLLGNDDGLHRHRLLVRLEIRRLHVGLVVEPCLGDEYGEQAEHDGEPDHDDGAGTQSFGPV
jgi:hypothetical protein